MMSFFLKNAVTLNVKKVEKDLVMVILYNISTQGTNGLLLSILKPLSLKKCMNI